MDLEEKWQRVIEETKVFRFARNPLGFEDATVLPYIFLGPSEINIGDTVVRKGQVVVDKPIILLPKNIPQFSGFDLEEELGMDENTLRLFFMVRGINFPSMKYKHEISTIEVVDKSPEKTIDSYRTELDKKEDVVTGLVYGIVAYWQLAILFYVSTLINRSASNDLYRYLKKRFQI